MAQSEFVKLKKKSSSFFVREGKLMRRHSPEPQIVISNHQYQSELLQKLHEELGYRGVEETYSRVVSRFWWPNLKKEVGQDLDQKL